VEENHWEPLLIDFGRGKTIGDVPNADDSLTGISHTKEVDARAQDIYDYGFLIQDLCRLWMEKTEIRRVRPLIIDVITQCISEPQPTMRHIVDIWERWLVVKVTGLPLSDDVDAEEAWEALDKIESASSFTRSLPSSRRGRSNSMFSSG